MGLLNKISLLLFSEKSKFSVCIRLIIDSIIDIYLGVSRSMTLHFGTIEDDLGY